ncbi:MAG: ATP-dependent DNA helicase RecG [Porphyromonadaceae bacterium]|nr:ATP-dependent DNA helicase RecG [Porphyromonadaceae bacterium]
MNPIFRTPLTYLPGVGPKRAEVLARDLELRTYWDLLNYFPYKYVDRSRIFSTREIRPDMPYIQLKGYIRSWQEVGEGRKKRLVATFCDADGSIELTWFRAHASIQRTYTVGKEYIVYGKPNYYNHSISIAHPEIDDASKQESVSFGLVPMYTTTERMRSGGLTNRQIRQMMYTLLNLLDTHLEETLPQPLVKKARLMAYPDAIVQIHFPESHELLEQARIRLKFDELFFIQIKLQSLKLQREKYYRGFVFPEVGRYFNDIYREYLPFDLTNAQKRVLREVRQDTLSGKQMNRLIQGDVGSGKTLVALLSMLLAVGNGFQACMMAPTEILARQHQASLRELLAPLGLEVGLLIGSTTKRERADLLPRLADGSLSIIVGTHALIEEGVTFASLGIAVIDEQHRFGVAQRSRLWAKNNTILPHILIMSATPIPRTLAMTLYGDLDISIIDELPPGRKPIQTIHHYDTKMYPVFNFLREELRTGRQAYVVYPMIEENEQTDLKDLESGYERYKEIFPEFSITMVHGKMKPKEKDERMQSFISGQTKILLATTVIEVGVNVPNASVMIIESANRFGLSQLHQLRGRVGRGAEQSYCILVTGHELGQDARRRIDVMVETTDGFVIAEEDMRLRGFGELEGTRQSGKFLSLKLANLTKDNQLVHYARSFAEQVLAEDPQLALQENQSLKQTYLMLYPPTDNWSIIS